MRRPWVRREFPRGLVDQQNGRRGRLCLRTTPLIVPLPCACRVSMERSAIPSHDQRHRPVRRSDRHHPPRWSCPVTETPWPHTRVHMAGMAEGRCRLFGEVAR